MADIRNPALDIQNIQTSVNAGPDAMALTNLSRERGNSLSEDNQVLLDRAALTPFEFQQKYGADVSATVDKLDVSADALRRFQRNDRTNGQVTSDAARSVNSALANFGGNIAAGAGTLLNRDLGILAAEKIKQYSEYTKDTQSPELNRERKLDEMRTALDNQDIQKQYDNDVKNDGGLVADLKKFGRDAIKGATRLYESPAVLGSGVAEGIGSIAGAAIASRLGLPVPLAIGASEGGGAFTSNVNEVMEMTHEKLMDSSPEYQALILRGVSKEDAQKQIASDAGRTAMAIQAPIATVTGGLVAKFEGAPLAVNSIKSAIGNMGRETLEEGLQSLSGQVAQNVGIQQNADENKELLEGAGAATAQGAALGSLSAGVIKTVGAVRERGERINAANAAASPVSEEKVAEAVSTATAAAPVVADSIRAMANEKNAPVEDTEAFVNRVVNSTRITPEEIQALPPQLQEEVAGVEDRFVALAQMARVAGTEGVDPQDRTSAAIFLLDQISNNKKLFDEDLPAFLENVSHDREEYAQFENYANVIRAIESVPSIREAMDWAQEKMIQEDIEVNDQNIQQVARNTVGMSVHTPQNINPNVAEQVLMQADRGTVELTPEQRNVIRGASSLIRSAQVYNESLPTNDEPVNNTDLVTRQIETEGGYKPYQYSMEQHVRRINEAASRSDNNALKERMTDLGLFARHMRNKAEALVKNINEKGGRNNKTPYRTLGANHKWIADQSKWSSVFVDPSKPNSIALAQRIYAEAQAVANLANNMAEIHPQFGIKPVTIPALPPLVQTQDLSRELDPVEEPVQENRVQEDNTEARPEETEVAAVEVTPEAETSSEQAPEASLDEVVVQEEQGQLDLEPNKEDLPKSVEVKIEPDNGTNESDKSNRKQDDNKKDIQETTPVVEEQGDLFSNLIEPQTNDGNKKKNFFKEAYKFPKKAVSRIIQLANPIKELNDLLDSPRDLVEFMGNDVDYDVTRENLEAYQDLLKTAVVARRKIKERLKNEFADKKDKSGKSLMDLIMSGSEVNRYVRARMLNIIDRTDNGIRYNPTLLESAIIAGIHWSMNSSAGRSNLDRGDVASIVGVDESLISNDDLIQFNRGMSVDMAKRSLAEQIIKFWGVNTNNNTATAYTKGIAEGVAAEVLYGLQEAGLIELGQIAGNGKTFNRVWTDTRPDNINNILEATNGASNLLADIVLVQRERSGIHIGKVPENVAKKQLRSPLVDNTKQQRKAIENEQNTPFYPNMVVHDFIKAMGERTYMLMMGGRDYNKGELNVNHEKSIEGINRTLLTSYRNLMKQMDEVKSFAAKNGMSVEDVPTYYEYNMSRVGRLQMQGLNNPQSDKLAREIFMPTKSTLDMTDPVGADAKKFWMTVGQGLGLKTEKLTRDQVMQEAQALVNGQYRPVINQLIGWLDNRTDTLPDEITNAFTGLGLSMHGVHSLLSVAQYEKANRDGELSNFIHYNYLEADGKTNGPINSLALLTTGKFTPDWLKLVAKGGYFIGSRNKTLNSHVQNQDGADLYETVTGLFSQYQSEFIDYIAETSPAALNQFQSLLRLMGELNADISFNPETNELVMKRGVAKNPLTISIYGSGLDGIAGNITSELVNNIYELISNGSDPLSDDLLQLINNAPKKNEETKEIAINSTNNRINKNSKLDPIQFTFTDKEFQSLKDNVRMFFVNQMYSAIDKGVMDNVTEATGTVQQATNLQSIVLTGMFHNEIMARLAEKELNPDKYPDYKKGDFLSETEMQQIYQDLMAYSPLIETGTQTFFLSGAERSDITGSVTINGKKVNIPDGFSRAIDDTLSSPAYIYGPTLAGVRGVPSLVIGTGDGQMMQNIATMKDAPKGTLKVFDGMNMPASKIDEYGKKVNQAVYDTWFNNPLQNVADSFKAFLRNNPLETLMDDKNPLNTQREFVLREISKAISGLRNPKKLVSPENAIAYMEDLSTRLDNLANEVSVRQEVLKSVDISIDQMASAESPFTQEGDALSGNLEEIAAELNRRYDEVLTARSQISPAVEGENAALVSAIDKITQPQGDGIRVAEPVNLAQLVDLVKLSPIHKEMLTNTLKNLKDSGYKVVFGSPTELANYTAVNHPDRYDGAPMDAYGKIDPVSKTIYVSNVSPETLIHELIHAATIEKTKAYYDNPKSLSDADRDALARLEGLMQEWLLQNYSSEDAPTQDARRQAVSTINGYVNNNRPAEALNEFMAWSLANQKIAEVMMKTKVKNPLFRIAQDAYVAIKKLVWGTKFAVSVDDTIFSNLRFNTRILLATPTRTEMLSSDFNSISMYQSPVFGSNDYISNLRDRFARKIATYVTSGNPVKSGVRTLKSQAAMLEGQKLAQEFIARGFHMDMQTASTFAMIQAALMVETDLNTASLTRIEDIYTDVIKNISVETFMNDPNGNDPADRYQAQEKYNILNGTSYTVTDESGRSSLMSSFLALSMTHEGFRSVLSKMDKPSVAKESDGSLDGFLTDMGNSVMDNLAVTLSGEGRKSENVVAAMDALTENLIENVGDQRSFIEQNLAGKIDGIDEYIASQINNLSEKVYKKSDDIINTTNNPVVAGTAKLVRFAASIVNEDRATEVVNGITSALNQGDGLVTLREFVNEIVGRTQENASIFDMISKVRAVVQQTRQQFREKLPEQISAKFSRPLTEFEWTSLFKGLGKTDLAALYASIGIDGALNIMSDNKALDKQIADLESAIKLVNPGRFNRLQEKAKQLANFMNTGEQGINLLRNAHAVAHLYGEKNFQAKTAQVAGIINQLDQLISLYAVRDMDQNAKDEVVNLIKSEPEGMKFALSYLVGERRDEVQKINSDISRVNHYKGHIPSENQLGTSLIVASDTEHARLVSMGYVRVNNYKGSSIDNALRPMSYYYNPVSGRATYNQGVLQTVHQTVSGIDPRDGFSTELTAGRITDPQKVREIQRRINQQRKTDENLLPVYDGNGDIIAFERGINSRELFRLNRNTNLAQMIGAWRGRQVEERLAQEVNHSLIDNLKSVWDEGKKDRRTNEFVNIANSTDPIHQDTWKLIPKDVKDYIDITFGKDGFRVRRDMINDAVGFRSASVGDLWTGNTRLSPAVQKNLENVITGIFGFINDGTGKKINAYQAVVGTEKFTQNLVSDAKVLIVIKSLVVPVANVVSNTFQLLNRGVPARNVIKGLGSKTVELNDYIKRRDREITLDAELLAARGANNSVQIRKIETELQSIKDSYKRMSIYPLIEAGEFSAISDGGITQEDLAIANGRWASWAETIASKLPDGIKTPYRYAMITRDTALFQGLTKSVQYGDFLGKSILYDDLTNRKGMKPEDALARISEEFVNYNRLAGRTRNYLESSGLLWFWNFKLRIMKVGVEMLRHHPVRSLMMLNFVPNVPLIGSIGSPVSDNFFTILADGKLGWSMGPGMGLNAPQLNPWLNVIR